MIGHLFKKYAPFLVIALAPCLLLWPVFTGQSIAPANLLSDVSPWRPAASDNMAPWNVLQFDGMAQFYPWRKFAADTLRSGYIPLWNPYEFCGTPFLANSQSAIFYPPNLIFVIMPAALALGWSALFHLIATGLFLYLFLRRSLSIGRLPACLGAIVWQLASWQTAWLALPTFLDTSAWFPLLLYLARESAQKPGVKNAVYLGSACGLMLLAGHLQIAFYGLALTGSYWLYSALSVKSKTIRQTVSGDGSVTIIAAIKPHAARIMGCALLAGSIMAALSAPQVIPALELSRSSHRAAAKASAGGYESYVKNAMPASQLATLIMPNIYGDPYIKDSETPYRGGAWSLPLLNYAETACYVGVLPLLLALVGAGLALKKRGALLFFLLAAIIALAIALGSPIDKLLYFGVPGFSQTGSPARILVLWALGVAILAASGLDFLISQKKEETTPTGWRLGGIALFAAASMLFVSIFGALMQKLYPSITVAALLGEDSRDIRIFAIMMLSAAALAVFVRRKSISISSGARFIVALAVLDLLVFAIPYNTPSSPSEVYPETGAISWLKQHAGSGRIWPVNHSWSMRTAPVNAVLPPNSAMAYGLRDVQGYDSLQTAQYKSFAQQMNNGSDPSPISNGNMVMLRAWTDLQAGSIRYIVTPQPSETTPIGTLVYSGNDAQIFENSYYKPRALANGQALSFRDTAPTRLEIDATSSSPITIADQWTPGWSAFENGKRLSLTEEPYIFRTVRGASPGTVTLRYEPASFRLGLFLGLIGVALITAVGTALFRNRAAG